MTANLFCYFFTYWFITFGFIQKNKTTMGNCTSGVNNVAKALVEPDAALAKHDAALAKHDAALAKPNSALAEHDAVPDNLIIAYARVIIVFDEISRIITVRHQDEIENFNVEYDSICSQFLACAMIHNECKVDSNESNEIHAMQKALISQIHNLTIKMRSYKKLILAGVQLTKELHGIMRK